MRKAFVQVLQNPTRLSPAVSSAVDETSIPNTTEMQHHHESELYHHRHAQQQQQGPNSNRPSMVQQHAFVPPRFPSSSNVMSRSNEETTTTTTTATPDIQYQPQSSHVQTHITVDGIEPDVIFSRAPLHTQSQGTTNNVQLLRSWARSTDGIDDAGFATSVASSVPHSPARQQPVTNDDLHNNIQSPPVAPAIVIDPTDNSNHRPSLSSYSYPVANLITSLVRTGIDHIQTTVQSRNGSAVDAVPILVRTESDVLGGQQQQQQQQLDHHHAHAGVTGVASSHAYVPSADLHHQQQFGRDALPHLPEFHSTSGDSGGLLGAHQETEYILVDGELIALPSQAPHQADQELLENMVRRQLMEDDQNGLPRNCRPKKVNRGVRRFVKMFNRGKNKGKQQGKIGDTSTDIGSMAFSVPTTSASYVEEIDDQQQQQNMMQQQEHHLHLLDQHLRILDNQQVLPPPTSLSAATSGGPSELDRRIHYQAATAAAAAAASFASLHQQEQQASQDAASSASTIKSRGRVRWKKESAWKEKVNDNPSNRRKKFFSRKQGLKPPPPSTTTNAKSPPSPENQNFTDARRDSREALLTSSAGMQSFLAYNHRHPVGNNIHQVNKGLFPPSFALTSTQEYSLTDSAGLPGFDHHNRQHPNTARRQPLHTDARVESVQGVYLGTTEMTSVTEAIEAESLIIDDYYDAVTRKKEDACEEHYFQSIESIVPYDADFKVDKADAPDVADMLQRAVIETTTDLEPPDYDIEIQEFLPSNLRSSVAASAHPIPLPGTLSSILSSGLKSDGASVPLSEAKVGDKIVHNDMLKVVLVSAPTIDKSWLARQLRRSKKGPKTRTTLAVEVHEWRPPCDKPSMNSFTALAIADEEHHAIDYEKYPVKFRIWDVQGATVLSDNSLPNFGVHPATQSLFFSAQSLYILVWDLACNNPKTNRREASRSARLVHNGRDDDDDSDFDDDDYEEDDFVREEANRQADRALHADISSRVLSWVDRIVAKGPMSAILPVALIPDGMSQNEIQRRCDMMKNLLEEHVQKSRDNNVARPNILTSSTEKIVCVHKHDDRKENGGVRSHHPHPNKPVDGIEQLQDLLVAIATDPCHSVFNHVGTPVSDGTLLVWDCIQRYKQEHKLILLDHVRGELGSLLECDEIIQALHFLSNIGEILYFGTAGDEVLHRYIVLDRKWLISTLSCILRNSLKQDLAEERRFMNLQCFYSDTKYEENDIYKALVSDIHMDIPLLSSSDAKMLWQGRSFMREAADKYSQLEESSTTAPTMFYFLERLLVHSGIFLPLETSNDDDTKPNQPESVFFVPSLLVQINPTDIWTFKSGESWTTTLCHTWLFRDGAPQMLMEHIVVKLLRDLYDFSRQFQSTPPKEVINHARSDPLYRRAMSSFYETHDDNAVGRVKIHQLMCWKSSLFVKIGTLFVDLETRELRESFVEVFVAVCNQSSNYCVASDVMRPGMQRVIVSGKGQIGHHGRKLWKGGYKLILESIRSSLSCYSNVDSQVICPECLAQSSPRIASTFGWDSVLAVAESGSSVVRCMRGHRVDTNLICGTITEQSPVVDYVPVGATRAVSELLPSVVIVGLWNPATQRIESVGSGFIVDKKLGLILTAGHIFFAFEKGARFGTQLIPDGRVVIGVHTGDGNNAVFRYWAEVIADDVHNIDACVVRICSRMESDVDDEGTGCGLQREIQLPPETIPNEQLRSLRLTKNFELEENVRLLGYNQGGEGVFDQGTHVNRVADFARGYICKKFRATISDDSSSTSSSSSSDDHSTFVPREEIVIMCSTISGHSGGPCVNNDGRVIGILCRSDPSEKHRCYLVPATELKTLVNKAKKACL